MIRKLAFFCFLLLVPAVSFAQPAISFGSLTYNFGVVGPRDKVVHVFEFRNRGDRDLVIEKLVPS